jgi:hypothetical protein
MDEFSIGTVVIINEKVARDLPMRVGNRGILIRKSTFNNFEFDVECDDGDVLPLKSSEVNKLTTEDKQYMEYIFTNNQVMFEDKKVVIGKVNYLTQQTDILDENGVFSIVEFKDLEPIHIDSVEELHFDIHEDLLNVFVGHYKNTDNTYTVPKEFLVSLIKKIYTGGVKG